MKKENHELIAVWKRRTGSLAEMCFQVKPRSGVRMEVKMPELNPAMRYFSRTAFRRGGKVMSRKDAVVLASRTLALLLTVWALSEASGLPGSLYSFLHYINQEPGSSTATQYWLHYHLITLGFLVTRIVGFSLMARWLYQGGPDVEQLVSGAPPR
jgi:hypothetical protein